MSRWFRRLVWDADNRLGCRWRALCDYAEYLAQHDRTLGIIGYVLRVHSA